MGTEVFEGDNLETGVDIFVHNLKNNPKGKAILILNTNEKPTSITIPATANQYLLTANELITKQIKLNGIELNMKPNDELPTIKGKIIKKGTVELPAHSIMFLTFDK